MCIVKVHRVRIPVSSPYIIRSLIWMIGSIITNIKELKKIKKFKKKYNNINDEDVNK